MSEYSVMPECELIKLKNMYLDKVEHIDRILRKESAVQKTEYAIQRLKKLMDTNRSYEYMCISEKRTGTGLESHYFVNIPGNVSVHTSSKDCIKISCEVFVTYEGPSTNQVTVSISSLNEGYNVYGYSGLNKFLDENDGSITFLTKESVEERANDALLKHVSSSIIRLRNQFSSNMITTKKIEVMSEASASEILSHMKALEGALRETV